MEVLCHLHMPKFLNGRLMPCGSMRASADVLRKCPVEHVYAAAVQEMSSKGVSERLEHIGPPYAGKR